MFATAAAAIALALAVIQLYKPINCLSMLIQSATKAGN
jgi:hypothetical protein